MWVGTTGGIIRYETSTDQYRLIGIEIGLLAKGIFYLGKLEDRLLSPFVADIENRLKLDETPRLKKRKKKGSEQMQLKLF